MAKSKTKKTRGKAAAKRKQAAADVKAAAHRTAQAITATVAQVDAPKIGRPSDYSQEIVGIILGRIREGESLRRICRDDGMPSTSTVCLWLLKHDGFSEQYARACEDRAHAMAEEALEIADDARHDMVINDDGVAVLNAEHVQRSRLRVDTRKWFAARLNPRKYGDRIAATLSGPNDGPIPLAAVDLVPVRPAHADAKD